MIVDVPNPVNLMTIAGGAAVPEFERELEAVLENIMDESTDPSASRAIVLRFEFKPGKDRRAAVVVVRALSKLAPSQGQATIVHVGRTAQGTATALGEDPNQPALPFERQGENDGGERTARVRGTASEVPDTGDPVAP